MKNVLIKTLLICASLTLTACSWLNDNSTQRQSASVENAQESIQQSSQAPANEPEAKDQNTLQKVSLGAAPASPEPIGGSIEKSMDSNDKIKMSRALDKSPGKTTSWTNNHSGVRYDVTPIRKIVLKDNPICRTYNMVATRGAHNKEVSGTACVSNDGAWHPM
jgi:surface antigen